ncbi:MAG TPA: GDSL-type esterase/lipase family protein [Myxococcota bacterium]|nr:GDSL-type esterase/lipase family protein [Myxococcota bacterium]
MRPFRARATASNLLLLACSSIFSLLLVEIGLRVAHHWTRPEVVQATYGDNPWTFFQYDPVLGWRPRAGAEGTFSIRGSHTSVRVNEKGLRDVDHAYGKGARPRLLALGDSFTWGYGVEQSERFTDRLQTLLGDEVEVINAAVTGYGTDQELLYLVQEGAKYAPDVVLLCFGTEDIVNIHNAVQYSYPKPYFLLEHGELSLHNVPVPQRDWPWYKRYGLPAEAESQETQPMWQASAAPRHGPAAEAVLAFLREHFATYHFLHDRVWTGFGRGREREQSPVSLEEHVEGAIEDPLTEALLLRVRQVVDSIGAKLVVVLLPYLEDVRRGRTSAAEQGVITFLQREDFHYVDLSLSFLRATDPRALFLAADPHWSPLGHQVAAAALADQLRGQGLAPRARTVAHRGHG